jgi:hypothetical protein
MKVIKVKPWGKDQGPFVLMEEQNFRESLHQHYDPEGDKKRAEEAEAKRLAEEAANKKPAAPAVEAAAPEVKPAKQSGGK